MTGELPKDFMEAVMVLLQKKQMQQNVVTTAHSVSSCFQDLAKDSNKKTGSQSGNYSFYWRGSIWIQKRNRNKRYYSDTENLGREESTTWQRYIWCFVDYEKAFDRVNCGKLMKTLERI